MEQEIRHCTTSDGVRIAYATAGFGPPLVKAANWIGHLKFEWRSPVWRQTSDDSCVSESTDGFRIPPRLLDTEVQPTHSGRKCDSIQAQ